MFIHHNRESLVNNGNVEAEIETQYAIISRLQKLFVPGDSQKLC